MGESLNKRITMLERYIEALRDRIKELSETKEEGKEKPYSKVRKQAQFANMNLIFDDISGMWKTYAIYKDDE